jgi:hypothetical protein
MKNNNIIKSVAYAICLILLVSANSSGQSLFKDYTEKSQQELTEDTEKLSQQIIRKFNQQSMEATQQKIYFYEYFSNLKKLVLYGAKLANYAQYKEDLKFARENELFKGLPKEKSDEKKGNRLRFLNEKYKMMQANIKDEIDTYQDLIKSSLDSCEHLALYDLSKSSLDGKNQERIQYYFEISKTYKHYLQKRDKLANTWPVLEIKIRKQIDMWQEKAAAPEDSIIDLKITEGIDNADTV